MDKPKHYLHSIISAYNCMYIHCSAWILVSPFAFLVFVWFVVFLVWWSILNLRLWIGFGVLQIAVTSRFDLELLQATKMKICWCTAVCWTLMFPILANPSKWLWKKAERLDNKLFCIAVMCTPKFGSTSSHNFQDVVINIYWCKWQPMG